MLRKTAGMALLALALIFGAPSAAALASQPHATLHAKVHEDGKGQAGQEGKSNGDENSQGKSQAKSEGQGSDECDGEDAACNVPEAPVALGLPLVGVIVLVGFGWFYRRRLLRAHTDPE